MSATAAIAAAAVSAYIANKGRKILQTLNEKERPVFVLTVKDISELKAREKAGEDMSEELAIAERTLQRIYNSAQIATIKEISGSLVELTDAGLNQIINSALSNK